MADKLVFLGLDRAGLEEAQADRERHARRVAAAIQNDIIERGILPIDLPGAVLKAFSCDRKWPTPEDQR
jgi:hypothetical protein